MQRGLPRLHIPHAPQFRLGSAAMTAAGSAGFAMTSLPSKRMPEPHTASIAAPTAATSPFTHSDVRPPLAISTPAISTLAALRHISAAMTALANPIVSTIPIESGI
jgi:hypothetical protein